MHVCTHFKARGLLWMSFLRVPSTLLSETESFRSQEFTNSARLTDTKPKGTRSSPPLQHWKGKHIYPHAFHTRVLVINLGASCLHSRHLRDRAISPAPYSSSSYPRWPTNASQTSPHCLKKSWKSTLDLSQNRVLFLTSTDKV